MFGEFTAGLVVQTKEYPLVEPLTDAAAEPFVEPQDASFVVKSIVKGVSKLTVTGDEVPEQPAEFIARSS